MKYLQKFDQRFIRIFLYYSVRYKYDETSVRVRFAPSPTGNLHLGGLRTALYNYLFAKSKNGTFILRIEDTDQSRLMDGAVTKLEDDLKWAGLFPDEGPTIGGPFGPYFQSQRLDLYKNEVNNLLTNGSAYHCFCTSRRLDLLRRDALRRREMPKYDNYCRNLSNDEVEQKLKDGSSYCIRFKLTPYLESFHDLVFGPIVHNVAEVEGDPIIIKSDGFPTYHLANVVDDHYMKITHILRGVEWQPSTVKHILLYKAFNWIPPKYAHLPLIMNVDGTKLSKRHDHLAVEAFRNDGIYPNALINFLTLCGGGFLKNENEKTIVLRSMKELVERFTLEYITVKNSQIPLERINEFNRMEHKRLLSDIEELDKMIENTRNIVKEHCSKLNYSMTDLSHDRIKKILLWGSYRMSKITDLVGPQFLFLWIEPPEEPIINCEHKFFDVLPLIIAEFENLKIYEENYFNGFFKKFAEENQLKYSQLMKFFRICLSGLQEGPGVSEMIIQLGEEVVLKRLKNAYLLGQKRKKDDVVPYDVRS